MAKYSLELAIYAFTLRDLDTSKKKKNIMIGSFFRSQFMNTADPNNIKFEELYKRFIDAVEKDFGNGFKLNDDATKGFSTATINSIPNKNVIEGTIRAGDRGNNHQIYDLDNNKKVTGTVGNKKLLALPHYFKIWIDPTSEVGILMVQNYSSSGLTTLLLEFLREFFKKYGAKIDFMRHTPTVEKDNFLKTSYVSKIVLAKTKFGEDVRTRFNKVFKDSKGLKVRIEISGFNSGVGIEKYVGELQKSKKVIGVDLSDLDISSNDDVKTTLYYTDENGKQAHAKIEKKLSITPTIVLPDELIVDGVLNEIKIRKYTDGILERVKKEI